MLYSPCKISQKIRNIVCRVIEKRFIISLRKKHDRKISLFLSHTCKASI